MLRFIAALANDGGFEVSWQFADSTNIDLASSSRPHDLNLFAALAKMGAARSGFGLQKSLIPLPFFTSFVASARISSASARALATIAGGMAGVGAGTARGAAARGAAVRGAARGAAAPKSSLRFAWCDIGVC